MTSWLCGTTRLRGIRDVRIHVPHLNCTKLYNLPVVCACHGLPGDRGIPKNQTWILTISDSAATRCQDMLSTITSILWRVSQCEATPANNQASAGVKLLGEGQVQEWECSHG